jgi:hypothetical protein
LILEILEAICFLSFIAAVLVAENIPLCAVLFLLSFSTGIVARNLEERKAGKHGNFKR